MDINQANKAEHDRLKYLIEKEQDATNKANLEDDLKQLEESPMSYWLSFDIDAFEPKDVVETQRFNTIKAMQNYYAN